MNAKHTPGPWEVHKQKDAGIGNRGRGSHFEILHPLINQEGEYKGQLGGYHIIIGEIDTPKVSEADARLIAAAPELLDCLKEAEEQSRKRLPVKKETWLKMRELIAKAEDK